MASRNAYCIPGLPADLLVGLGDRHRLGLAFHYMVATAVAAPA